MIVLGVLCLLGYVHSSPMTIPLTPEGALDKVIPEYFGNKKLDKSYHTMVPDQSYAILELDHDLHDQCNIDLKLQWSVSTGSPIYATPVIFPKEDESELKNIFIASYTNTIELIEGDGHRPPGWPISFDGSTFQASPLIYDIDGDGHTDMGLTDTDGNLYWIRIGQGGEYLEDYHIQIPKLYLLKNWYKTASTADGSSAAADLTDGNAALNAAYGAASQNRDLWTVSLFDRVQLRGDIGDIQGNNNKYSVINRNNSVKHAQLDPMSSASLPKAIKRLPAVPVSVPVVAVGGGEQHRRLLAEEDGGGDVAAELAADQQADQAEQLEGQAVVEEEEGQEGEDGEGEGGGSRMDDDYMDRNRLFHEGTRLEEGEGSQEGLEGEGSQVEGKQEGVEDDGLGDRLEGRPDQEQGEGKGGEEGEGGDFPWEDQPATAALPKTGEEVGQGDGHSMEDAAPDSPTMDDPYIQQQREHSMMNNNDPDRWTARRTDDGISYYMQRLHHLGGGEGGRDRPFYGEGGEEEGDPSTQDKAFAEKFLRIDAHVLATPAMGDLTGDGQMEIIFPVSYYYTDDSNDQLTSEEKDHYFASGLVCWSMAGQSWLWTIHLDLTTAAHVPFLGMIYSSPTIYDLDRDGRLEVIIGTGLGMVYIIDAVSGFVRHGFPLQVGSIQASIAIADLVVVDQQAVASLDSSSIDSSSVDSKPQVEMIICDMLGNVLVMNPLDGSVLYDLSLNGPLPYTPTIGDVNGDGILDIVVITLSAGLANSGSNSKLDSSVGKPRSSIWAISGQDGSILPGFPLALPNQEAISGSAILATLDNDQIDDMLASDSSSQQGGMNILVTSMSGKVYILGMLTSSSSSVDQDQHVAASTTFCVSKLDSGSPIASARPLLEDVTGDGYVDLLVSTLSGDLLLYETSTLRHPLVNSVASYPRAHHHSMHSIGQLAIVISETERQRLKRLDVKAIGSNSATAAADSSSSSSSHSSFHVGSGDILTIDFEIIDHSLARYSDKQRSSSAGYTVTITRGSNQLDPLFTTQIATPGKHRAVITPFAAPQACTLHLAVTSLDLGYYAEETVSVEIATRFYIWMKYFLCLPIAVLTALALSRVRGVGKR